MSSAPLFKCMSPVFNFSKAAQFIVLLHLPPFIAVKLNANRHVTGVLRGFDQFMNIVLDTTVDEKGKVDLGMVVIRGNSIITIEALERVDQ